MEDIFNPLLGKLTGSKFTVVLISEIERISGDSKVEIEDILSIAERSSFGSKVLPIKSEIIRMLNC